MKTTQNIWLFAFAMLSISLFSCNKAIEEIPEVEEKGEAIEDQIVAAGQLATDGPVSGTAIYTETDTAQTLAPIKSDLGLTTCTNTPVSAYEVRELSGMLSADAFSNSIFPGAIIQGKPFEISGQAIPVTIPRAGGEIILAGLSGGTSKTETVDEFKYSTVSDKIAVLLDGQSGEVKGTVADFTYTVRETSSREAFLFNVGLDARFPMKKIEAQLALDKSQETNTVILEFRQVFYTIGIDDPETMYALFRDGKDAEDPENQISPDNPPLYVSNIYYGRQVFFKAESNHSTSDIKASLEAAYGGLPGNVKLSSGFTRSEVLNESSVWYIVRGGNATEALKPINSGDTYQGVLDFIAEGGSWSQANPGAPIAFDLKYLQTRAPARMAFTADFIRKNCELYKGIQYEVTATKIECIKCLPEADGKAEFEAKAHLNTNEEPKFIEYALDIRGVPISGAGYYENKSHVFSFQEIGADDQINFEATLVERDNTTFQDFGQVKKTITLKDFPNGGNFSLRFRDMVGTSSEQEVRLWFLVTRLN